jgi:anti-sigma-K factor RskA
MTTSDDNMLDLLTAYALGVLEAEEIAQVSALLAERPELRALLAELRATADHLPYALPEATPPPELRQRVLDHATGRAAARPQPASPGLLGRARTWIVSLGAVAAAATVAAVLGWSQVGAMRSELAQVRLEYATTVSQVAQVQTEITTARTELNAVQAQIAEARQVLASLQGNGGSGAILETRGGDTVLVAQLPPLQAGREYQVWRIQGTNAPVSAALFTVNAQGYGRINLPLGQQSLAGQIVAITDEPAGGSAGPTTQPLIAGSSGA